MYKGRLKENGDLVAVKVQRPFVLETVTIDLFIIRKLGLALRNFPQVSYQFLYIGLVFSGFPRNICTEHFYCFWSNISI